jgi:hypothetical protein
MQIKKIFNSLTLTSIFWIVVGFLGLLLGCYWFYKYRVTYFYSTFALIAYGGGGIICGLTNGFTDQSAFGRKLSKFGLLLLLIGTALFGFFAYRYI